MKREQCVAVRTALVIFVFVFTAGVVCAVVCPEETLDTAESKAGECTQCISTHFLGSTKVSDDLSGEHHAPADPATIFALSVARRVEGQDVAPQFLVTLLFVTRGTPLRI